MTIYFVTRHKGAREWAARRNIDARAVDHLDPETLVAGDVVIGSLPAHVAAEVCRRGGRFVHLAIDSPAAWRGRDLTADEMDACNAHLVEIDCSIVGPYQSNP